MFEIQTPETRQVSERLVSKLELYKSPMGHDQISREVSVFWHFENPLEFDKLVKLRHKVQFSNKVMR